MKRLFYIFVIGFSAANLITVRAHAAIDPTPQPASTIQIEDNGTATAITVTQDESLTAQEILDSLKNPPNRRYEGQIGQDTIKTPDLSKEIKWLEISNQALQTDVIQKKTVLKDNPQYVTAKASVCGNGEYVDKTKNPPTISNMMKTAPIEWLVDMQPILRQLGTIFVPGEEQKSQIYNEKTIELGAPEDCFAGSTGEDVSATDTKIASGGNWLLQLIFNIPEAIVSLFTPNHDPLTTKTTINASVTVKLPYAEYLCNIAHCDSVDSGDRPIPKNGFADTYNPSLQYNTTPNGNVPASVSVAGKTLDKLVFPVVKAANDGLNFTKCAILPGQFQGEYTDGCDYQTAATGSCSSKSLPTDWSVSNSSCSICNADDLNSYLARFNKKPLSDLFLKILAKAGETYHVPAAMLLSYMYSEGSLQKWDWTEENTKEWSVCGGVVPKCDQLASSEGARGPFSIISKPGGNDGYLWYDWNKKQYIPADQHEYGNASKEIDPERSSFSPCNFLDAAFAYAKKIGKESGGSGNYPYTTCWGHPLYKNATGSASSCSWGPERITTAVRQLTGYCTEPGKNGSYPPQTKAENHFDRAFEFMSKYQCR